MPRRSLLFACFCLCASLLAPLTVLAVTVDQELQDRLAAKGAEALVPVLMIFDAPLKTSPQISSQLDQRDPRQRRHIVLESLKEQASLVQRSAATVLRDPLLQAEVAHVQSLYLANAMVFEATAKMVAALGQLPDGATLFWDKSYDLTAATSRGVSSAAPPLGGAATDTVWSVKYINAHRVWQDLGYTGDGVVVGHIDTGVWLEHPDLAGRLWTNLGEIPGNGLDDDANGFVDDILGWDFGAADNDPNDDSADAGHGTHTAGTVAGDGNGGTLTGVAPGASLMVLKVWEDDGTGGSLGLIWAAEQYAVENGARIITMSLAFPGPIPAPFMRAERANAANIRDAGVTIFNSSGNERLVYEPPLELGLTARVPAPWSALPVPHSSTGGVISIGGTGYQDNSLYVNSSQGPARWDDVEPWLDWAFDPGPGLIKPDLVAPGTRVNSTVIGGGYSGDTWNGTSMACPHAAGVAALMLEKNPSLSPAGIDSLLELNAVDVGATGKDNSFGSGQLDALAIVSAVPLVQNPDLVWVSVAPDFNEDGVIDVGVVNDIAIELKNVGHEVLASGVTATLAVMENPYVTVADAEGSYGDLVSGASAVNTDDAFSLSVAAETPQGFAFTMLLTVFANGSYEQTYDITWNVGLPDWRTHDQGGMYLTVTDQGIIGYTEQSQTAGRGMGYQDESSGLFLGSFWAGTDENYICNRDYGGLGSETFEWEVSDPDPNGRVRDLGSAGSDETFVAIFTDAGHASPKPLLIEQTSLAFAAPENDHFVILEYRLTNEGPVALPGLYNGIFCDFDLGEDSGSNLGGIDTTRNLTYLYATDGPYMGIALLGAGAAQNLTLISNETYVFETSAITDEIKMSHLRGLISTGIADRGRDWSALTSSVVDLAANGGQAVLAYALVAGASLAEIEAAVDAANVAYDNYNPDMEKPPVLAFQLAQNTPNPFNPTTEIKFTLARSGFVDLAVYNVGGRRIRTLVAQNRPQGEQLPVVWNGRNDQGRQVPSGIYFYKFESGGQTLSRKMTVIR